MQRLRNTLTDGAEARILRLEPLCSLGSALASSTGITHLTVIKMQALTLLHLRAGCGVLGPQRLTKFKHLAVACRSPLNRGPASRRRHASHYKPAVASASAAATAAGGLPQTYG